MGEEGEVESVTLNWVLYENLEIKYKCRDCGETFSSEHLYIQHFEDKHEYDIEPKEA